MMADQITLEQFVVDAIVGITEAEQRSLQPVEVELSMVLNLDGAGDSGDLTQSVDYYAVQQQVISLIQAGQWRLIESMGLAIARWLLVEPLPVEGRAEVLAVTVKLRKPTILDGAVPGLELHRTAAWADSMKPTEVDAALVQTLCATKITGAYRVVVPPNVRWLVPPTAFVHVVTAGLADDRPVAAGTRLAWGSVEAITADEAPTVLLVVSRPPL